MSFFYSPGTRGFYSTLIQGAAAIPADGVAITDAQYATLLAGVNSGQVIALVAGVPTLESAPPVVPTLAQLQAYAGAKAAALLATMRAYTASGVTIKSDATAATLADWLALLDWAAQNPSASTQWVANDFTVATATAAQIAAIGPLVGPYAQLVYTELATVLGEIASTTITTTAQIDAFGWTV